jgi:hypothetical protein
MGAYTDRLTKRRKAKAPDVSTDLLSQPIMHKSDKGEQGGSCNRTACQRPGAVWFHQDTRRWYCTTCARELNRANHADAMRIYGSELLHIDREACVIAGIDPDTGCRLDR